MSHISPRARSALLPVPTARPVFAESLPPWEFPPSWDDFAAARRRALASLSSASPDPDPPSDDDDEDTNPGAAWEEVAP